MGSNRISTEYVTNSSEPPLYTLRRLLPCGEGTDFSLAERRPSVAIFSITASGSGSSPPWVSDIFVRASHGPHPLEIENSCDVVRPWACLLVIKDREAKRALATKLINMQLCTNSLMAVPYG